MGEQLHWHWFQSIKGVGQKEKEGLLEYWNAEKWFMAAQKGKTAELFEKMSYVTEKRKQEICTILESKEQTESAKRSFEKLCDKNIQMVSREDLNFPKRLKHVYLSPFVLYYKGKLPADEMPSIGIIGARNCSTYGEEIAAEFAKVLSDAGIQIISGMARGIDGSAGRSALKGAGGAYGVLGNGVDICYPKDNYRLYEDLCNYGGVLSEEIPGTMPANYLFPKRNRIIAGLSDALFVVEAREKSGSLITVSYALEQGKEIYAVPGRIYDHLAEGTNRLIQEGAYLVREPADILDNFKDGIYCFSAFFEKKEKLILATEEKIVYACLSLQPKHIEQIAEETGLEIPELMYLLFELEEKKWVKQPMKNYYMIQSVI